MNRLILKYQYPVTAVILLIFAWVIYTRISQGWGDIITLAVAAVIVWALGAPAFICSYRRCHTRKVSGLIPSNPATCRIAVI